VIVSAGECLPPSANALEKFALYSEHAVSTSSLNRCIKRIDDFGARDACLQPLCTAMAEFVKGQWNAALLGAKDRALGEQAASLSMAEAQVKLRKLLPMEHHAKADLCLSTARHAFWFWAFEEGEGELFELLSEAAEWLGPAKRAVVSPDWRPLPPAHAGPPAVPALPSTGGGPEHMSGSDA